MLFLSEVRRGAESKSIERVCDWIEYFECRGTGEDEEEEVTV